MLLETDKVKIGNIIKKYRKLNNYSQFELAEKIDIHEKQIYRIESGLNYPAYPTFVKLMEVLNIDVSVFDKTNDITQNESYINIIDTLKTSDSDELKLYWDVIYAIRSNQKKRA